MRINIAPTQLAFLFPTYLVVDQHLVLQSVSPALARDANPPLEGDSLLDHFRLARREDDALAAITAIANRMEYLQLYGVRTSAVLAGTAIALEDGFLLATNRIPDAATLTGPLSKAAGDSDADTPMLMLISIQKALLEEARQTATQLAAERQRSEDMLTRFRRVAGFMAHDFNNLLSVVRLNADLLMQQKGLSQKVSRRIQIMAEVAERGSEITHSLMSLSSQKHDTSPPLAIDEHIFRQRAFFTTSLGARHRIEFKLRSDGAYAEVARADLTNCVLNLVINARDAMPDGGTVTISTKLIEATLKGPNPQVTPSARQYVAITVHDNGLGMNEEVLARAFEPFFSTKVHGTGVGLASVQDFARDMGGDASVESTPEDGTSVHIYLPRCEAPAAPAPVYDYPVIDHPPAPQVDREWRILLVDDEVHATAALTELLEGEGFTVTPATDYHQAASALADQNFDLLLADVVLPQSNGIALANHACDIQQNLRVIMMSGYAPNSSEMRDDWLFMRKPLDPAKLVGMIRKALTTPATTPVPAPH